MTLKELLGDAYKEGISIEEIESALQGKRYVDTAKGEYIPKDKFLDTEKKLKEALKEKELLAAKQKGTSDDLEAEKKEYLEKIAQLQHEVNKSKIEGVLKGAGLAEDDYKDFIDAFIGEDMEASETRAKSFVSALTKKTESAKKDAEAALKAQYLKDGVRLPDVGGGQPGEGALGKALAESAKQGGDKAITEAKDYYK